MNADEFMYVGQVGIQTAVIVAAPILVLGLA